jgi:chromosome segregation ATPase
MEDVVDEVEEIDESGGSRSRTYSQATSLETEIDRLSLAQAIRDFEIANARTIDLTQRLISANERIRELQKEADELRVTLASLQAAHDAMKGSHAFRIAEKIWAVRNAVGR